MPQHVFHTKHDFTPEFAWGAFQLLAQIGADCVSAAQLQQIAQILALPLAKRADLHKLLGSFQDLGLVERQEGGYALSAVGRLLWDNNGRSEIGFRAAFHCLYSWEWLLDAKPDVATPSWSYRAVCREILGAGPSGVEEDDLVLRVVEAAQCFRAEKVSFSRSSVHGVVMWLEALAPSLISRKGSRLFAGIPGCVSPTSAEFHLAALCELNGGRVTLNASNVRLLQESWLVSREGVMRAIAAAREFAGFDFVPSSPPLLLSHHVNVGALEWLAAVRSSRNDARA